MASVRVGACPSPPLAVRPASAATHRWATARRDICQVMPLRRVTNPGFPHRCRIRADAPMAPIRYVQQVYVRCGPAAALGSASDRQEISMDMIAATEFLARSSTLTQVGWIGYIVIGAIAGWIAGKLVKGGGSGILMNIVIGIVGALRRRLPAQLLLGHRGGRLVVHPLHRDPRIGDPALGRWTGARRRRSLRGDGHPNNECVAGSSARADGHPAVGTRHGRRSRARCGRASCRRARMWRVPHRPSRDRGRPARAPARGDTRSRGGR